MRVEQLPFLLLLTLSLISKRDKKWGKRKREKEIPLKRNKEGGRWYSKVK